MARPRKGQKGYKEASNAWRETMLKKYGSEEEMHKFMVSIGRKGGKSGYTGGFYGDSKRARSAGAIGGKRSKRGYEYLGEKHGKRYYRNRITGETISEKIK